MKNARKAWGLVGLAIALLLFLMWAQRLERRLASSLPTKYLGAVSGYFMREGLTRLRSSKPGLPWFPIPFCLNLDAKGNLTQPASCDRFYRDLPGHPLCALQNLNAAGDWDPQVVQLDPLVVGVRLSEAMQKRGCYWLMIDIESLKAEDRRRFSEWSAALAGELRKKLPHLYTSIAVHGKNTDLGEWPGAEAQDWAALCKAHDEILVMAYDYHYPGSTKAGETAPLDWVEEVLKYGKSVCRTSQLRLGLAAYGYRWPRKKIITEREWMAKKDPRFFVETAAKREEKLALARRYGVESFFMWALGMDVP